MEQIDVLSNVIQGVWLGVERGVNYEEKMSYHYKLCFDNSCYCKSNYQIH